MRERRARWPKTAAISRMLGQERKRIAEQMIAEMRQARGHDGSGPRFFDNDYQQGMSTQLAVDVAIVERLGGLTPAPRMARH